MKFIVIQVLYKIIFSNLKGNIGSQIFRFTHNTIMIKPNHGSMIIKNYMDFGWKNQNLSKLLNNIKFADRIIFGKLNYNVVSSRFKDNHLFYEACTNQVIEFCKTNNIDYHIKFGTLMQYNQKTEVIFKKPIQTAPVISI